MIIAFFVACGIWLIFVIRWLIHTDIERVIPICGMALILNIINILIQLKIGV